MVVMDTMVMDMARERLRPMLLLSQDMATMVDMAMDTVLVMDMVDMVMDTMDTMARDLLMLRLSQDMATMDMDMVMVTAMDMDMVVMVMDTMDTMARDPLRLARIWLLRTRIRTWLWPWLWIWRLRTWIWPWIWTWIRPWIWLRILRISSTNVFCWQFRVQYIKMKWDLIWYQSFSKDSQIVK